MQEPATGAPLSLMDYVIRIVVLVAGLALLAGCQQYEPVARVQPPPIMRYDQPKPLPPQGYRIESSR